LFDEWQDELKLYTNDRLPSDSANKLQATKRQYTRLITAMRRAGKSVDRVLNALRDNVLYLKHNLKASAMARLKVSWPVLIAMCSNCSAQWRLPSMNLTLLLCS
jgi:hypothetical protein